MRDDLKPMSETDYKFAEFMSEKLSSHDSKQLVENDIKTQINNQMIYPYSIPEESTGYHLIEEQNQKITELANKMKQIEKNTKHSLAYAFIAAISSGLILMLLQMIATHLGWI